MSPGARPSYEAGEAREQEVNRPSVTVSPPPPFARPGRQSDDGEGDRDQRKRRGDHDVPGDDDIAAHDRRHQDDGWAGQRDQTPVSSIDEESRPDSEEHCRAPSTTMAVASSVRP